MANMFANGEKKQINDCMKKSFNFTYLLSFPIMFGFKNRKLITQDEKIIDISIY